MAFHGTKSTNLLDGLRAVAWNYTMKLKSDLSIDDDRREDPSGPR